jgi:hypothetical protein
MRTKNQLHHELKHKFILEKLLEAGVTKSQQGVDIHLLDYVELKYEWVLLAFREIDIENKENGWF